MGIVKISDALHEEVRKTSAVMETLGLEKSDVIKSYNEAIAWADEQSSTKN